MGMDDERVWLTYAGAAKRVQRDVRSIRNWRRNGMPMEWRTDELGQRYRVVEESVLLAWWRDRMNASPVHFYRMRARAIERGETPQPAPERFTKRPTAPSTASQVPKGQDDPDRRSDAVTALLADLPVFHGQAEHAALIAAMENEPPGCDGLEVFTHDRFDDPQEVEMMRVICRACPLLELCEAFAAAGKPSAGLWAGMTPAEIRRMPNLHQADKRPVAA